MARIAPERALLPELIRAARPIFTRSREPSQVPQQIRELQDAVDHNDQAIKALATEMAQTLSSLKQASLALERTLGELRLEQARMERRLTLAQTIAAVAASVALLAFAVAAYALAR